MSKADFSTAHGIEPQPKPLGDLLKDILRQARSGQRALRGRRLAQKVFSESFKEFASQASVVSIRVGVITIETDSSVVFQELEGFYRQRLLDVFRNAGLQAREVRVRLAV